MVDQMTHTINLKKVCTGESKTTINICPCITDSGKLNIVHGDIITSFMIENSSAKLKK